MCFFAANLKKATSNILKSQPMRKFLTISLVYCVVCTAFPVKLHASPGFTAEEPEVVETVDSTSKDDQKTTAVNSTEYNPFQILPNPSAGDIQISIHDGVQFESMSVIGMNGRVVLSIKEYTQHVDLTHLNDGIYTVALITNLGPFIRKLVIKR